MLLAPLGRSAAEPDLPSLPQALWRPASFGRAVLATPLLLLMAFGFFRAGYQVTSGLDPNDTVNAWGGPTYIGAMACHYLDMFVIMAAAAGCSTGCCHASRRLPAEAALASDRAAAADALAQVIDAGQRSWPARRLRRGRRRGQWRHPGRADLPRSAGERLGPVSTSPAS